MIGKGVTSLLYFCRTVIEARQKSGRREFNMMTRVHIHDAYSAAIAAFCNQHIVGNVVCDSYLDVILLCSYTCSCCRLRIIGEIQVHDKVYYSIQSKVITFNSGTSLQ